MVTMMHFALMYCRLTPCYVYVHAHVTDVCIRTMKRNY